ncbi:MAG: response regulator [Desulfovermiculus sp.]
MGKTSQTQKTSLHAQTQSRPSKPLIPRSRVRKPASNNLSKDPQPKIWKPKHRELVLLVEDNEMVRNLVEKMLNHLGYLVICAQDGFEAVQIFRHKASSIGLVLSDVSMPGKNGWQVLSEIREFRSDIPVILASGYYEGSITPPKQTQEPHTFLLKPFTMAALQETIENVMQSNRLNIY